MQTISKPLLLCSTQWATSRRHLFSAFATDIAPKVLVPHTPELQVSKPGLAVAH